MSRNGSGVQTSPGASFPAVAATLIESAKFNSVINDINTEITRSIASDGQTTITANLPMGGFKHTGVEAAAGNGEYVRFNEYVALTGVTGILPVANGGTGSTTASTARTALGAAKSGANTDITSLSGVTSINGGPLSGTRNILINGGFTINQRAYVSAAALAAGQYGHDRWKAGASGGDYTFTQLNSNTQITISAAKTLIQVVEDKNVQSTSYVLSWTGTAKARYAVNSNTPAGAYAVSPILITGQTAGQTMSIEFNTGTLSNVQLEPGATSSVFEQRHYGLELALCQRYFQNLSDVLISGTTVAGGQVYNDFTLPVPMRASPTAAILGSVTYVSASAYSIFSVAADKFRLALTLSTLNTYGIGYGAALSFSAEL